MLPDYSVVHKQDIYLRETYRPDFDKDNMNLLGRSYELHFNERPYLNHFCYLFLTKTTKENLRRPGSFSTLCRGHIVPRELEDRTVIAKFMEAVDQFESIINDSGLIRLERLSTEEIIGTPTRAGIIEKYLTLSQSDETTLCDIRIDEAAMSISDKTICLHTLADLDYLPGNVSTDSRYERLSTDRSDCRLSFAAPVGLMLTCDHIYNQMIFIEDSAETLKHFEKAARNMHSLSKYSRANQINKQWVDEYLNDAHSFGLRSVRAHFNVMA